MPELTAQFEAIKKLHDEDLAAGYAGVFLDDQLDFINRLYFIYWNRVRYECNRCLIIS